MTENSKITSIQNIPFKYNRKIRDIRMLLRVILGGRVQIPAKTTIKKVVQMAERGSFKIIDLIFFYFS